LRTQQIYQENSYLNIYNAAKKENKNIRNIFGKVITFLARASSGIVATVCAIATIILLPFLVLAYAVLRMVDQVKGVKFIGSEPQEKSLCKYPLFLLKVGVHFTKVFGEFALTGKI
jgi:hypothetical protein